MPWLKCPCSSTIHTHFPPPNSPPPHSFPTMFFLISEINGLEGLDDPPHPLWILIINKSQSLSIMRLASNDNRGDECVCSSVWHYHIAGQERCVHLKCKGWVRCPSFFPCSMTFQCQRAHGKPALCGIYNSCLHTHIQKLNMCRVFSQHKYKYCIFNAWIQHFIQCSLL